MAATDALRDAWTNLSERERRMVSLLGAVFAALAVFGVVWVGADALSTVEEENDAIAGLLRDIGRSRARLSARASERQRREARYRTKAPSLASFVEGQAQRFQIQIPDARDLPDKKIGSYNRRAVQVQLRQVKLRPLIDMLESIESSTYPVAIHKLDFRRRFGQPDQYDVEMTVVAFDAPASASSSTSTGDRPATRAAPGVAGPPPP
ncbi:MAG: type II secretion system protein M [Deltaproteobacteria bacterium]|nr:type II secretion system protein M [Deltaproteobacteria bacterium]